MWNSSHTMDLSNLVDNGEWELLGMFELSFGSPMWSKYKIRHYAVSIDVWKSVMLLKYRTKFKEFYKGNSNSNTSKKWL